LFIDDFRPYLCPFDFDDCPISLQGVGLDIEGILLIGHLDIYYAYLEISRSILAHLGQ
jgi:hypothetical protein